MPLEKKKIIHKISFLYIFFPCLSSHYYIKEAREVIVLQVISILDSRVSQHGIHTHTHTLLKYLDSRLVTSYSITYTYDAYSDGQTKYIKEEKLYIPNTASSSTRSRNSILHINTLL